MSKILLRLLQVALFLGAGALIGFLLGLAYASHLYGTSPVVAQLQSWFAGDTLADNLPVDIQGALMRYPVSMIPVLGACFGFFLAVSVLFGNLVMGALINALKEKGQW